VGKDIPLGRIAGIKVGMNISVLLVGGLYTVLLATNRFPIEAPGLSTTAYWVAGAVGAVLLFLSLLVHELGHALVARDEGIGVRSMALTLLGGVTRLESSPTTARSELRVAGIGPLASLACGVALLSGAYTLPGGGLPGLSGRVLAWVGVVNILLAIFNLVPASPLDGGKVLSALIWMRTGSQVKAMRWAAAAGVAAGVALMGFGIWDLRRDGSGGQGILLLIVGAFILLSAVRELQASPLYAALEGAVVGDAMATDPPIAASWTSIVDFLRAATPDPDHQAYPVVGPDGRVTGLLTAAAIRAVPPDQWAQLLVSDLAYPMDRVVRLRVDEDLIPAVQKVEGADAQSGVVVAADGTVVGTLDPSALHRALTQQRSGLALAPSPAR
jgi:Zn-dependent protease